MAFGKRKSKDEPTVEPRVADGQQEPDNPVEVSSFGEAGLADTSRGDGGHGSSGGHASL